MPESEWPKGKKVLPGAKIAMARIKRSQARAFGEASTHIILDRTEGPVKQVIQHHLGDAENLPDKDLDELWRNQQSQRK